MLFLCVKSRTGLILKFIIIITKRSELNLVFKKLFFLLTYFWKKGKLKPFSFSRICSLSTLKASKGDKPMICIVFLWKNTHFPLN